MNDILSTIPDLTTQAEATPWIEKILVNIAEAVFPEDQKPITVSAPDKNADPKAWRQFVLAGVAADWACYLKPDDRAEFDRMQSVLDSFPEGFKIYFAKTDKGEFLPVGYTGWYPISEEVFNLLSDTPEKIKHRGAMVPVPLQPRENYVYLFNFSIAPQLVGSVHSRALIKDYAGQIVSIPKSGMAAVTVSKYGISACEKFGLHCTGQITHNGDVENVYSARSYSSSQECHSAARNSVPAAWRR